MFHEVKVFDPKGRLKKTLTANELSNRHWREFNSDENVSKVIVGKGKRFRKMRKKNYDFYESDTLLEPVEITV